MATSTAAATACAAASAAVTAEHLDARAVRLWPRPIEVLRRGTSARSAAGRSRCRPRQSCRYYDHGAKPVASLPYCHLHPHVTVSVGHVERCAPARCRASASCARCSSSRPACRQRSFAALIGRPRRRSRCPPPRSRRPASASVLVASWRWPFVGRAATRRHRYGTARCVASRFCRQSARQFDHRGTTAAATGHRPASRRPWCDPSRMSHSTILPVGAVGLTAAASLAAFRAARQADNYRIVDEQRMLHAVNVADTVSELAVA